MYTSDNPLIHPIQTPNHRHTHTPTLKKKKIKKKSCLCWGELIGDNLFTCLIFSPSIRARRMPCHLYFICIATINQYYMRRNCSMQELTQKIDQSVRLINSKVINEGASVLPSQTVMLNTVMLNIQTNNKKVLSQMQPLCTNQIN